MTVVETPLLEVRDLIQHFDVSGGRWRRHAGTSVSAVDDVSFDVFRGERLGIVGESGSGKTTVARAIAGLRRPDAGSIRFDGLDLLSMQREERRRLCARLQLVLQDPLQSLDPRMSVLELVREGLVVHGRGADATEHAVQALDQVGIGSRLRGRRTHALSGGQRQRVALARSLALKPDLLILDEPVSALDISVQSQILNLLLDVQESHQLTYVFIVHDLAVARWFCDRVLVMQRGQIVEEATSQDLFERPRHEYTRALLAAVPGQRLGA